MTDPKNEQIKKVQIADVDPKDDASGPELEESQLEKVSGGGSYGPSYDGS